MIDKAEITRAPYRWIRFDCATWLADGDGVESHRVRLPAVCGRIPLRRTCARTRWNGSANICFATSAKKSGFYATFEPFQNWIYRGHGTARGTHATWILMRAGAR